MHGLSKSEQHVLDHGSKPLVKANPKASITKNNLDSMFRYFRGHQKGETLAHANKIQALLTCRNRGSIGW